MILFLSLSTVPNKKLNASGAENVALGVNVKSVSSVEMKKESTVSQFM